VNLLDVLQAASNAAAQNVSGPVDLLSFGLRKAGVPVPENAVGSTQWMRERGLWRDVEDPYARAAGETLGILGPIVVAAKAPQIAGGLLQMQENAAKPGTIGKGMGRKQRGVFKFDGLNREQIRNELQKRADAFADPLRQKGFDVDVQQSGSAAGSSLYARVYDPQTGRYVIDPFRFSDHSKGAWGSQFVHEMSEETDIPAIYKWIDEMRAKGPSAAFMAKAKK